MKLQPRSLAAEACRFGILSRAPDSVRTDARAVPAIRRADRSGRRHRLGSRARSPRRFALRRRVPRNTASGLAGCAPSRGTGAPCRGPPSRRPWPASRSSASPGRGPTGKPVSRSRPDPPPSGPGPAALAPGPVLANRVSDRTPSASPLRASPSGRRPSRIVDTSRPGPLRPGRPVLQRKNRSALPVDPSSAGRHPKTWPGLEVPARTLPRTIGNIH